jgi:anthranilate phosphoribosyltransferase
LKDDRAVTQSWPDLLSALLSGQALDRADAAWAMGEVMDGEVSPVRVAAFAVALRAKGETSDEVTGLVESMLARAVRLPVAAEISARAVDTCGTGGDRAGTVNISTLAALVVAGAGVPVIKHGNRAASSQAGSADLLEEFGVQIDLDAPQVAACVAEAGIGFCFAPRFHPALRHAAVARRELGVRTVFNVLGPLTNPAQPGAQAVGVADLRLAPVLAGVLATRGVAALVLRCNDGLDELTTSTTSQVWEVQGGRVTEHVLDPTELGIPRSEPGALRGGDAHRNAEIGRRLLDGETGAVRDAVLLNAAAALVAADAAASRERTDSAGLPERLAAGLVRAAESLDSGAASAALDRWVRSSRNAADGA